MFREIQMKATIRFHCTSIILAEMIEKKYENVGGATGK